MQTTISINRDALEMVSESMSSLKAPSFAMFISSPAYHRGQSDWAPHTEAVSLWPRMKRLCKTKKKKNAKKGRKRKMRNIWKFRRASDPPLSRLASGHGESDPSLESLLYMWVDSRHWGRDGC
ncbi:hypothetical protein D8B26_001274 [Coccidioides posadasii str. Silveira]|uniref:uncharacterized protein n=1 Tax=Coccidioides posadasii (strain RMSCC 757 / Silveira) TaxID=443226 RepID=UPI001BEEF64C|nr:hypothetical protein D8B26_001274 [Coccidioides posadasii str. Silveira]